MARLEQMLQKRPRHNSHNCHSGTTVADLVFWQLAR